MDEALEKFLFDAELQQLEVESFLYPSGMRGYEDFEGMDSGIKELIIGAYNLGKQQ